MHQHEELLGADYFEHDIRHPGVGVSRAVSVLKHYHEDVEILEPKGQNEGKLWAQSRWHSRKLREGFPPFMGGKPRESFQRISFMNSVGTSSLHSVGIIPSTNPLEIILK